MRSADKEHEYDNEGKKYLLYVLLATCVRVEVFAEGLKGCQEVDVFLLSFFNDGSFLHNKSRPSLKRQRHISQGPLKE